MEQRIRFLFLMVLFFSYQALCEEYYGLPIGTLNNLIGVARLEGTVYLVNKSCIQIIDFSFIPPDTDAYYFWLDENTGGYLTPKGDRLPTFEYGSQQLGLYKNQKRVVLPIIEGIDKYRVFGIFAPGLVGQRVVASSLPLPTSLQIEAPRSYVFRSKWKQIISVDDFNEANSEVRSDSVTILDRRTIEIINFKFPYKEKNLSPSLACFGMCDDKINAMSCNVQIRIRGLHKEFPRTCQMSDQDYQWIKRNSRKLIIETSVDIIDKRFFGVLSGLSWTFYGGIDLSEIPTKPPLPPYVPEQQMNLGATALPPWTETMLIGDAATRTFHFQLGPALGARGYRGITGGKIPRKNLVWYVNGYMSPTLFLHSKTPYTFIIEGGNTAVRAGEESAYYNPLYISEDDPNGGYGGMSHMERLNIKVLAGIKKDTEPWMAENLKSAGRLCIWRKKKNAPDPDDFNSFGEYQKYLELNCAKEGKPGKYIFTPADVDEHRTIFYQSYANKMMGFKIIVLETLTLDLVNPPTLDYIDSSSVGILPDSSSKETTDDHETGTNSPDKGDKPNKGSTEEDLIEAHNNELESNNENQKNDNASVRLSLESFLLIICYSLLHYVSRSLQMMT